MINFDPKHTKYWLSQNTPNRCGCGEGCPTFIKSWDSKGLALCLSSSFWILKFVFLKIIFFVKEVSLFFFLTEYTKTITITCLFRNANGYIHLVLAYNPQKREQCPIILSPSVIISPRLDIDEEGYHIRDSKKEEELLLQRKYSSEIRIYAWWNDPATLGFHIPTLY